MQGYFGGRPRRAPSIACGRQDGLTRHEALHAIGAVLGRHISVMSCNPAARRATLGGGMRQTWRG